ncbi:MAG: hypothetical protein ACRDZZ_13185 [Ilumatobacteraceae bacterium]
MRRARWFVGGVATGAAGVGYATRTIKRRVRRTVKRTTTQLAPTNVARGALRKARQKGRDLGDAVREGRDAMRTRERELRAHRDGRVETLDDQLGPDDELLVDGRPVETGRVIVLRRAK